MPQPPQFRGSVLVSAQAPKQLTPLLQLELHLVPSHDAVAPAGSGQGVHDEPQVSFESFLLHVPLQSC